MGGRQKDPPSSGVTPQILHTQPLDAVLSGEAGSQRLAVDQIGRQISKEMWHFYTT